ncbi:MarR family winged helix-turn-helix transcriptional regulator [Actinoplanes sp. NPDC049681]|uniref:MarR family winged helix-turn-helix transcriptional regulator n=1 Tax=Actinoplanes sp. NPDC049681 TaxID=3363905 RepID=UPI0037A6BC73
MDPDHAAAQLGLAVRHLLQAGRHMQAAMAARLGLRTTDLQAIDHVVSAGEPIGPVELGQRLGIRSASATVLVNRLVRAGHLERRPHPGDRRRITLAATEHAHRSIRDALNPLLVNLATVTDNLDEQDLNRVLTVLSEVIGLMRAYGDA